MWSGDHGAPHFAPMVKPIGYGECWFGIMEDRTISISAHANEVHKQGRESRYEVMRSEIACYRNQAQSAQGNVGICVGIDSNTTIRKCVGGVSGEKKVLDARMGIRRYHGKGCMIP